MLTSASGALVKEANIVIFVLEVVYLKTLKA